MHSEGNFFVRNLSRSTADCSEFVRCENQDARIVQLVDDYRKF